MQPSHQSTEGVLGSENTMAIKTLLKKLLNKSGDQPFVADRYWEDRHRFYRGGYKAVGSVELSDAHIQEQTALKQDRIINAIQEEIPNPEGKSLLEAGCGIGLLTPAFCKAGFEVVAVDFSPTAIAEAETRAGDAQFIHASLPNLKLNRTFNVITVIDVLLHITDDDEWQATLKNLARHLAPTGIIVIFEWIGEWRGDLSDHCRMRSMNQYATALTATDLAISKVSQLTLDHEKVTKQILTIRHARD